MPGNETLSFWFLFLPVLLVLPCVSLSSFLTLFFFFLNLTWPDFWGNVTTMSWPWQRDSVLYLMTRYHSPRPSWQRPAQLPWQCWTGIQKDKGQETTKELGFPKSPNCLFALQLHLTTQLLLTCSTGYYMVPDIPSITIATLKRGIFYIIATYQVTTVVVTTLQV